MRLTEIETIRTADQITKIANILNRIYNTDSASISCRHVNNNYTITYTRVYNAKSVLPFESDNI